MGEGAKYDIRFLVRIRGAFTPPPRMDVPVIKMPLVIVSHLGWIGIAPCSAYDGKTYVEAYAEKTPRIWTCFSKKFSW